MPTQPTSTGQNTGLIVMCVGIFMVIIAFLTVTYMNSDTIRTNQDKNSHKSQVERANLTQITCALWQSEKDHSQVTPDLAKAVSTVCTETAP